LCGGVCAMRDGPVRKNGCRKKMLIVNSPDGGIVGALFRFLHRKKRLPRAGTMLLKHCNISAPIIQNSELKIQNSSATFAPHLTKEKVNPSKQVYDNILGAIGHTPLVRINSITKGLTKANVYAKVETFNPGNSIKDRMALKMIEDAEKDGRLKPGGTIIEGTSGNTGMGLAIAAIIKGYKCIFTTTDKQSKEKVDALKAFGAEVIVCPTNVDPEDPRSYYSVSSRLIKEVPNSWKPNQYDNLSNSQAHYEQTGPEIWEQTEGKITHLVVGVGTGGTICGTGKYLKEKNPNIKIWGIDTYGSVFKKYKETGIFDKNEIYPYITEGIGEDFLPQNVDFSIIDLFEKVTDKDAAIMTRRITKEEGIFAGNSAGSAMAGLAQLAPKLKEGDVVVVIFHDHGTRYLGKMFNDDWMREKGFFEPKGQTAKDVVSTIKGATLKSIEVHEPIERAVKIMRENDFSQMPVTNGGRIVGSINEMQLFDSLVKNPEKKTDAVETIMQAAFPFVDISTPVESLATMITPQNPAVLVRDFKTDSNFIITRHDIIKALC
jgi:cystathionine beta-synthase